MKELHLNSSWRLHEAPLDWEADRLPSVQVFKDGWLPCELPVDIHMPLIEAGIIKEPTQADYWLECGWTEKRSWWFFKRFSVDSLFLSEEADIVELVANGLDTEATIFVTG